MVEREQTALGLAACLALLVLAAGCVGFGGEDNEAGETVSNASEDQLDPTTFREPTTVSDSQPGGEPVVDVASDGTIFLQGIGSEHREPTPLAVTANNVWRSTDGGESFEDVTPPADGGRFTGDAYVHVGPDDTVYVANSMVGYMSLWRSTDLGESWERAAHVPLPGPMHRMWLDTTEDGTVHALVYGLVNVDPASQGTWHMRSTDRGQTWTVPTQISGELVFGTDLEIGPGGDLYVINLPGQNEGQWTLYRSENGDDWETTELWSVETRLESSFQSLTVDEEGTLYFTWAERRDGTSRILHASSTDGGETWTGPAPLFEREGSRTLPWVEALAPGRLSVVWYAADEPGVPAEHDTEWYIDHALVADADTADPTSALTRVTPEPVHQGTLCNDGPGCGPGENRDLLDFPWVDQGPEGDVHLAFASTEWERSGAFPLHARQVSETGGQATSADLADADGPLDRPLGGAAR